MINNLSCYSTFQCSLSKQRYGKKTFDWSNAFRVSCRHSKSGLKLRSLCISNLNHFIENFTEDALFNANSCYTRYFMTLKHLHVQVTIINTRRDYHLDLKRFLQTRYDRVDSTEGPQCFEQHRYPACHSRLCNVGNCFL